MVFGVAPLISNVYWCRALRQVGIDAKTWMTTTPRILDAQTFDVDFDTRFGTRAPIAMSIYFLRVLLRPTTIFTTCEGFLLGMSVLWRLEAHLLRVAGSKVVVIPYGADSYVYSEVRSHLTRQALQFSYPLAARRQIQLASRVRYWVKNADVFIPGAMFTDGFGRADVVTPSPFCIDLEEWAPLPKRKSAADAKTLVITHAPNHRGFKGTEFLVRAVQNLNRDGLKVELRLLEGKSNNEVKRVLLEESDLHVEQLIFDGYAFNAIEAMAAQIPVVANLSDPYFSEPLKYWSFMDECPIISANPNTIEDVLRLLYHDPYLRDDIAIKSREYVSNHHSLESFRTLFLAIQQKFADRSYPLWRLYHQIGRAHV